MNEGERDPRIDAAWRTASRDAPPGALDDAIRAAARRAVGSAPQRKRDKHWWYPFAAAATVAAIAVGLLQLTPPEQVTPTIVTDAPKVAKREAASIPAPAPPHSNAIAPGALDSGDAKKKLAATDERGDGAGSKELAQKPQRQLDAADKLAPMPARETAHNAAVPVEAPSPAAGTRRSEPFPAAAPETARRDAAVATEAQGRMQSSVSAAEPAAPPPAAASPPTAGVAGGTVTGAPLEEKRMRAKSALGKDALEAPSQSRIEPRSVEDWIKLIRDLRREGRTDEATKEIAAFRNAYGDRADSLLPADLRAFGAPAK